MLYILMHRQVKYRGEIYTAFETHTQSVITWDAKSVIDFINKSKMQLANAHIEDGKIQMKQWPHNLGKVKSKTEKVSGIRVTVGSSVVNSKVIKLQDNTNESPKEPEVLYILLGKVTENRFKVVDNEGLASYIGEKCLKEIIESGTVANCTYEKNQEAYKSMDTCNLQTDPKFADHIANKYEAFRAKTSLLGLDISFYYTIEDADVKITDYTGKSRKVMIPSFITTICEDAFLNQGIYEIKLSEGLKYIGNNAFRGNNIEHVIIPKTVEFIGQEAFKFNDVLDVIETLNPNTIIIKD